MTISGQPKPSTKTDYRLILATLEKRLLAGELTEKDRRFIARSPVWRRMDPEHKVRWAGLAQMAGEMDAALAVLADVNKTDPGHAPAWKARLSLLGVLGRGRELAALLPRAGTVLDAETLRGLSAGAGGATSSGEDSGDAAFPAGPFERLRLRQERIDRYLSLFSGRKDVFARQWVDREAGKKGYVPVRRTLTRQDVEDHLSGRRTYGIYLLDENGAVSVAAVDADLKSAFRSSPQTAEVRRRVHREKAYMISRVKALAGEAGAAPLVEFSGGKGFHFWFFFKPKVPAAAARRFLSGIVDSLAGDLSAFSLEVFPKQDRLSGKGLGNLIKLPLGVHRLTGKTSCFPECPDRSTDAQLDFLSDASWVPPQALAADRPARPDTLVAHPGREAWVRDFPELADLERKCPPLGQVIALCMSGGTPAQREERVLFQTVGFLPRAGRLLHHLLGTVPDYNPHLVDFKISRLRGTPLGCRRIHSLLGYEGEFCRFPKGPGYPHPLRHVEGWQEGLSGPKAEKAENLKGALDNLRSAIDQVLIFLA